MRPFWIVFLAALIASSASAASRLGNYIAAIVNDSIITGQEVEKFTEKSIDVLRRTYFNQPEVFEKKRAEVFDEGLQQLLERILILDDFKASGLVLPDSYVEEEIKERNKFVDRQTLTRGLHAEGLTVEIFRQRVRDDLIVRIMMQRNFQTATLVSPAKIERYYREHLADFQVGEQAKLRMIVLGRASGTTTEEIKKLAEEVHSKIKAGASFAEMAGIYSEGSTRRLNGDWGWVERGKLNKGLAEIAFNLQSNQVSGVIGVATDGEQGYWIYTYENGQLVSGRKYTSRDVFVEEKKFENNPEPPVAPQEFYIMLVEARQPPRTKTLDEVQDQIEKDLLVQEHERLRKKWVGRLKEKAFVRYFF